MKRVGFVGWRGMVGSVLMQRMLEEGDFERIDEAVFFTTSQLGQPGPDIGKNVPPLQDATDFEKLKTMDVIVTCQGGDYTKQVFADLRTSTAPRRLRYNPRPGCPACRSALREAV